MRRLVLSVGTLALAVAVAAPGSAAPQYKTHIEKRNYSYPSGVVAAHHAGVRFDDEGLPKLKFKPRARDRMVTLEAVDNDGFPVIVHVHQDAGPHGMDMDNEFCDLSSKFGLVSHKPITVSIYEGFCDDHQFGWATSGTVTLRFSTEHHQRVHMNHYHGPLG